jgi:hypothetical protein
MIEKIKEYTPLLVVGIFSVLFSLVTPEIGIKTHGIMSKMMGYFLCLLSMFKFFDLPGFAQGFLKYDWVSQRYPYYRYGYPFIELGLGVLYISGTAPLLTNLTTLGVMGIGGYGVLQSLLKDEDIQCVCLGAGLNLPLSSVTAVENIGMAVMALLNIISYFQG